MFTLSDFNKTKYEILSTTFIDEENLEVVELCHKVTNAKLILLICDDENRVFNIAFKTPVSNSKGIPHILEHSVLCGSRKYNVKDPFIELAKGSLNTFLNAMTYPDKTCFPVASANLKDFHNLMDVYLDAVFYPNAVKDEKIFLQEGWHYELEEKTSDLKVNGVVYNEMRGVYSDPDSILESAIFSNLYANTNYAYESGGHPDEIINLSFEEFKDFHKRYYSASNSTIYLYGKLDYNEELKKLEENYLKDFDRVDVKISFKDNNDYKEMSEKVDYYSIDNIENAKKAYLAYSFGFDYEKTSLNNIIIKIIDYVLFSSESAILRDKFLSQGYGESVISFFSEDIKNSFYSIIAQNIDENKKEDFIKLFDDSIKEIIEDGLDADIIKAGINSLYFSYREDEYSRLPRGLYFSLVSLETYLYGGSPLTFLQYKESFDFIKKVDLNDKNNIFIETIKKLFVSNKHRTINVLRPKMNYSAEKEEATKKVLREKQKLLSKEEFIEIEQKLKELKDFQSRKEDEEALKSIPCLKVSDIDREKIIINYEKEVNSNVDTIISYENDKDIVYIELRFDISDYTSEEIFLFSIIVSILSKIDLDTMSFKEFNNYVDINTGGLDIKLDVFDNKAQFVYYIKTTADKVHYAFDIFYKLFAESNFLDAKRILLLLNEKKTNSLLSVLSSGHLSAINRANVNRSFACSIFDKVNISGISFYRFINRLCNNYEKNCDLVNDALDLLYKKLHRRKMYLTLSMNKKYHDTVIDCFDTFLDRIVKNKIKHIYTEHDEKRLESHIKKINEFVHFEDFDKKTKSEAIITPNDINFCAYTGDFDYKLYSGRLFVLRTMFNYQYLWTNIRVLGGAYGCSSAFNRLGYYSLVSYRDPNVSNTNKVYERVKDYLLGVNVTDDEINKYIIGSIGIFDNPISVFDKYKRNISAFFNNLTNEDFSRWRKDILDIQKDDIRTLSKVFEDVTSVDKCALISLSKLDEAKEEYESVWQLIE